METMMDVRQVAAAYVIQLPWVVVVGAVLLLALVAAALAVIVVSRRKGAAEGVRGRVYFGKKYLLTAAEASFYGVLRQAVGGEFVVMAKIRVADVIDVRAPKRERQGAFNRINAKHLDFVLLDARDLTIRAAVELDDASHQRESRRERDAFLEEAMKEAGVPLVRVKAAAGYRVAEVAGWVREAVARGPEVVRGV